MKSVMSKRMTKFLSIFFSMILFVSGISTGVCADAKTTSELRNEKSKIQDKIDSAQDKLDELSAQKKETQEYINTLQVKIDLLQDKISNLENEKSALQAEINATQKKINDTENEIRETQKKIDQKQAEFDALYEAYCDRLRAMYISGSASTLEVLLTCSDLSSLLTRSQMIKSVSEQDSQTLEELMDKMEEIEKEKEKLQIKRTELKEDKKSLEDDKADLQSRINEIASSKSEVDKEAAECNALMRKLAEQSSECLELIETNEEQLREVENEIRAALARASSGSGSISGSTGSGSGQLGYPTNNHSVSTGYPNYSSGRYHGGVDFRVPTGSNVYASAAGTVILVKYLTYSYGRYIIIDHGNGLSTLYAHNSQLLVGVGQQVSRGQVIAKSGSTGNSTGPHVHFEVRVNGNRVSPYAYL